MPNSLKYRRRQVYLGVFVLLLSVFSVAEGVYFRHQDSIQRACIGHAFTELSDTLDKRGDLAERESNQNRALWMIYAHAAGLVKDDPTKPLDTKDRERLQVQLVNQLLEYRQEMRSIQQVRESNQIPPFPEGKCEAHSG